MFLRENSLGVTARLVDWLKNYDPADGVHEIGHGGVVNIAN